MNLPNEGSSLFGLFQLRLIVFPVMASITGGPSGGSGTMSAFTKRIKTEYYIRVMQLVPTEPLLRETEAQSLPVT